ncbi:helix-turn-helix domain-containing protein [Methylobacterium durans]|uniref:helix-turn-helix domain-containing protein n=1 Tax=Methylobacterium durans TaxID=2202825 RepID=UPI0013A538AE|nr:helix-turn-helix domain-containing protein [Methylobacterium durans]
MTVALRREGCIVLSDGWFAGDFRIEVPLHTYGIDALTSIGDVTVKKPTPTEAVPLQSIVDEAGARVSGKVWRFIQDGLSEPTIRRAIEREAGLVVQEILLGEMERQRAQGLGQREQRNNALQVAADTITYRVPEAAKIQGIGKSKLHALISPKRLPARKVDGTLLIRRVDLEALVDSCQER